MRSRAPTRTIAVLTSGGDAPGMNAAVRAVVRTALARGQRVFAIREGYEGAVAGGDRIVPMTWSSVGGILHQGGTVIGTARSDRFRSREGRLQAAENFLKAGIDSLVVIGGDGSLSGADVLRQEWPELVEELAASGAVDADTAAQARPFSIVGLAGTIDNDMSGTDITIGADTALHRITEAIDAIASTAASHQRTFVVEVMGRHCGYLALMGAIATGASWVLIPESPPDVDDWEATMCERLRTGRQAGRRDSIVVVAEGARDRHGNPITAEHVRKVLQERLNEDVRVTILGHVQRGGAPSAFDRYMSTLLGHAAVEELLSSPPGSEPQLIGMKDNRVTRQPLMQCVEQTRKVAECVRSGDYAEAMALRGPRLRLGPADPAHDRARPPPPADRGAEALPLRDHARRRARPRHEHRRPRRAAPHPRPRPPRPRRAQRLQGPRGGRLLRDGLDERQRLGEPRGGRARDEPPPARRPRALPGRPPHREARDRRDPDDRGLVGLRRRSPSCTRSASASPPSTCR